MQITYEIKTTTKMLVVVVIIVHLMFFVLEALFWMQPFVHNILLGFLDNPVNTDYPTQALTLKSLFINQGFYNLFVAGNGVAGLILVGKRKFSLGSILILSMGISGFGAGLVLLFTSKAYILAAGQAIPALITAVLFLPRLRKEF